jgi:hypothetical protein
MLTQEQRIRLIGNLTGLLDRVFDELRPKAPGSSVDMSAEIFVAANTTQPTLSRSYELQPFLNILLLVDVWRVLQVH